MVSILFLLIFSFFCSAINKPKLCINCKHFMQIDGISKVYGKCLLFPLNSNERLVVGYNETTNYYYCTTARSHSDMCGEEGKLFLKKRLNNL